MLIRLSHVRVTLRCWLRHFDCNNDSLHQPMRSIVYVLLFVIPNIRCSSLIARGKYNYNRTAEINTSKRLHHLTNEWIFILLIWRLLANSEDAWKLLKIAEKDLRLPWTYGDFILDCLLKIDQNKKKCSLARNCIFPHKIKIDITCANLCNIYP